MKKYLLIFLFFLSVPALSQEESKDYTEALKLISVWLDAQKDYERLPGITASIISDQELLWTGAYGMANIEDNVKAEPEMICSICSISKLFTSVGIMKLYDEGKLRLDDNIADILPWYDLEQQYIASGPITIRTLLSHSAGLPRENSFSHWNGPDYTFPTKEQIISTLSTQKTLYPASTYYQYSNLALSLLGYVIEEISGKSFEAYIEENILTQLGLSDTRPSMPESLHGRELAIGYGLLSRKGERKRINFFQANGVNAAAGFSSNVLDLAKFASWQFRLRDTTITEILKPSTLRNMHNVHWMDPDWKVSRGLGFGIYKGPDGDKWVGHGGYCPGYQTTLRLHLESEFAYSVMINANGVNPNKYVNGMHAILKKVKAIRDDSTHVTKRDLTEYSGYYEMEILEEIYISTWEGKLLMIELPTDSPAESMTLYKHIKDDQFQRIRDDEQLGEILSFERNENGIIDRMIVFENYIYSKIDR
ncbi:MAG: serine hydrolase domain-containing protein [Cyclobacteriaceae bacterium]|jgi:CubicO group peptidase (beta-lactamase class C family)